MEIKRGRTRTAPAPWKSFVLSFKQVLIVEVTIHRSWPRALRVARALFSRWRPKAIVNARDVQEFPIVLTLWNAVCNAWNGRYWKILTGYALLKLIYLESLLEAVIIKTPAYLPANKLLQVIWLLYNRLREFQVKRRCINLASSKFPN